MKMELIECSETSAYNNQTPGKYPKEYIQDSKHGESLKSRIIVTSLFFIYFVYFLFFLFCTVTNKCTIIFTNYQTPTTCFDFHKVWYSSIFRKICREDSGLIKKKSDGNTGLFTSTNTHVYDNVCLNSS